MFIRKRIISWSFCVLVFQLLFSAPVHALTFEEGSADHANKTIMDYIKDYVDVPEGGIDWKVFGTTKEVEAHTKTEEGYDNQYSKPEFTPEVKALDGKDVKIRGYMFPLDATEEQKLFLFGPFPLTCPFQYHVGPPLVIEVHADNHPITFDYEPLTVEGKLELVFDDPEYSVFYRLNDARQIK